VQRGFARLDQRANESAAEDFTRAIEVNPKSARAYYGRALARRRLGATRAALADATASLDRNARSVAALNLRAALRFRLADFGGALADHQAALELAPNDAATLNHVAWLRATCPQDDVRDGNEALQHARRACELTDHEEPGFVDTLAAAFAEVGRFEDAVKWQQKAVELVGDDAKGEYESRLTLYRDGQPFREAPPEVPPEEPPAAEPPPAEAPNEPDA